MIGPTRYDPPAQVAALIAGRLVKSLSNWESRKEVWRLAVSALLPALMRGMQRNAAKPGGLDSLVGALGSGNHQRYVEEPETLADDSSISDGNAILGHIFGSKNVSRNVAGGAAKQTGIDPAVLKMLPMLAGVAMGALSKETQGGSQLASAPTGTNPLGALSGLLGAGADDSGTDDLLNLAKNFL